jgi:hypothetical protein
MKYEFQCFKGRWESIDSFCSVYESGEGGREAEFTVLKIYKRF